MIKFEFLTILDPGGIEIFSYPRGKKLDIMGGAIVAALEAINNLQQKILEKVHLRNLVLYVRRLKGGTTLIIAFNVSGESVRDEDVSWFIEYLIDEVIKEVPGDNLLFVDQVADILEPTVDEAVSLFDDIQTQLNKLNEAHRLAKEIIGSKADELLNNCGKDIVQYLIENQRIFIKKINGSLKTALKIIMECKEAIKTFLKIHF